MNLIIIYSIILVAYVCISLLTYNVILCIYDISDHKITHKFLHVIISILWPIILLVIIIITPFALHVRYKTKNDG